MTGQELHSETESETANLVTADHPAAGLPFVSVLMPVRNEGEFIERSLGSVLAQSYPHELLEIIVSDGESTDGTLERITEIAAGSDIPVKVVQNPKKIAPSALNVAISHAIGEMFVRVDGHCEIDTDYIAACVTYLTSERADGVGGPIETIGNGPQARAISLAMSSTFGVGGSAFRTVNDREIYVDTVAFPGYTRQIVERAGPYNEELVRNQDDEYNYRIRKLGGKILLSPTIRSKYYSRSTFRSLWRQYFQYGYWKVRVLQMHPKQMSIRQFVPFLFVLSILVLGILSLVSVPGRWILGMVICTYLAANLVASFIAAGWKIRLIPYISWSFCILHFAYGLGSIVGLVAFRNKWGESDGASLSGSQTPNRVPSKS